MKGGDITEFVDCLAYGDELIFTYRGQKFFIQGFFEVGKYTLYLARWEPPLDKYAWVSRGDAKEYPVKDFLAAPLWDGRGFMEAQAEMEWIDD